MSENIKGVKDFYNTTAIALIVHIEDCDLQVVFVAFAIASGTKLFTALAACKLIDSGLLSLENRVCDIIPYDLKSINKEVTVFHLLSYLCKKP